LSGLNEMCSEADWVLCGRWDGSIAASDRQMYTFCSCMTIVVVVVVVVPSMITRDGKPLILSIAHKNALIWRDLRMHNAGCG
jgi:hypothetical protein